LLGRIERLFGAARPGCRSVPIPYADSERLPADDGVERLLDRKTRTRLALGIAEQLSDPEMSTDSRNLILQSYQLDIPFGSRTVHDIIATSDEETVVDLAEYFDLDVPKPEAPQSRIATVSTTRPLFIFASHLSAHKALVGQVRTSLQRYGIELFVAHDTIEEDSAWEEEIRLALDRADAGLVFVHQGLKESDWCDQEIGWLQGRHIPVMALRFDSTPYGFFAKYQAQPVSPSTHAGTIAEMTVDRVAGKRELSGGLAASLVSAMRNSTSFATTDLIWKRLRELSDLDANLCSQLLDATKTNTQIHWANSALDGGRPYVDVIVEFLRKQPGSAVIGADIESYAAYLSEDDVEEQQRQAAAFREEVAAREHAEGKVDW
jgi:TIR domain